MKITKKHFELFKTECKKWIDRFELNNWSTVYEHKNLGNSDARSKISGSSYNATIALTDKIDMDFDIGMIFDEYIKSLAKHEVIHLLLGRLSNYGASRYVTIDEMTEAEEELVIKLLNIIK